MSQPGHDILQFYFNIEDIKSLITNDNAAIIVTLELFPPAVGSHLCGAYITAEGKPSTETSTPKDSTSVYGCPTPPGCGHQSFGKCVEAEEHIKNISNYFLEKSKKS